MHENLTYEEALKVVSDKMKESPNLHSFCEKYAINYNVALSIKNGKASRQYPLVILKLLKAFKFKAEMKREILYVIRNN